MSNYKKESLKFMLDTAAYNRLNDNEEYMNMAIKSLDYGFSYYKTDPQTWELKGFGAKVYDEHCKPTYYKKNVHLPDSDTIDLKLKVEYASCAVNLMPYHTLLDGTAHVIDTDSKEGKMFQEILEYNESLRKKRPFAQHYDAFIAESAIYNNCILVTNDGPLKDFVNKYFEGRAITTVDLINTIQTIVNEAKDE